MEEAERDRAEPRGAGRSWARAAGACGEQRLILRRRFAVPPLRDVQASALRTRRLGRLRSALRVAAVVAHPSPALPSTRLDRSVRPRWQHNIQGPEPDLLLPGGVYHVDTGAGCVHNETMEPVDLRARTQAAFDDEPESVRSTTIGHKCWGRFLLRERKRGRHSRQH